MITFDGERSKQRKWFAEKQLRVIKDLDLPAKTVLLNGFTVRVFQQGDISGGRITAPMGLVICRSTLSGAELFSADYWLSSINSSTTLHLLYKGTTADVTTALINRPSEEDMIAAGYQAIPYRPMEQQSPFGLTDGVTIDGNTVYATDTNPTIGLVPFYGEGYFPVATANMFIDLNENDVPDIPKTLVEYFLNFYNAPGLHLGGRLSVRLETGNDFEQPLRTLFGTTEGYVEHQMVGYEAVSGNVICGRRLTCDTTNGPTLTNIYAAPLWADIPTGLRDILLDTGILITHYPIGAYAFGDGPTFLQGVNCTNTYPYWPASVMGAWFNANPGNDKWKLFYTLSDGVTDYIVDSDSFISVLDAMADVEVIKPDTSINWENARRMLQQLFPWPNADFVCPYDSVMFNDSSSIYTWTRKYGTVKFGTTALTQETIYVPAEIATDGVRPEIIYSGTYGDPAEDFFVCMCNDVGSEILAIYAGTPMTAASWKILPSVPAGHTLSYARIITATPEVIRLIGVVIQEAVGEDPARHRICYLNSEYSLDTFTWTGEWLLLSYLPTEVVDDEIFTAALFGVGEGVKDMVNFVTRPHVLPQMPVGPYAKYAIGLP